MSTIKGHCKKWWLAWSSDGKEGPGQAPADGVGEQLAFVISPASFLLGNGPALTTSALA